MNTRVMNKRRKKLEAQEDNYCLVDHDDAVAAAALLLGDLPEDCIYNIFVGLPLESLCTLRLVCKSWCGIVNHTLFPNTRGIIFTTRDQDYSPPTTKNVFSARSKSTFIDLDSSFHIKFMEFNNNKDGGKSGKIKEYNTAFEGRITATCDGLIVLEKDFHSNLYGLVLYNPVTREHEDIPMGTISSVPGNLYGLASCICHASSRRYYKLLNLFIMKDKLGCEILDIGSGGGGSSWRAVDVPPTKRYHLLHSPVFAMGALHWIQFVDNHVVECMVSIPLDDEKFKTTPIPPTGGGLVQFSTVFAMGKFLGFSSTDGKSNQIQVWILRGTTDECGWEKQYDINASGFGLMIPLLYCDGHLVFKCGGGGDCFFAYYNPHSQRSWTKIETTSNSKLAANNDYWTIFPHVNTHVSWRRRR